MNKPTEYVAGPVCTSRRQRQLQTREDAILEAAQSLINTVGYEAMTMDDLADRAGISKPTLYQHFVSKEAIAIAVLTRRLETALEFIASLPNDSPAITRWERVVRWVIDRKFAGGKPVFSASGAVAALKAHPDVRLLHEKVVQAACDLIDQAKAEGDVSPRLHTRVLAQMVFSLVRDAEYEELLDSGECSPADLTNTILEAYFGGVRTRANDERDGRA